MGSRAAVPGAGGGAIAGLVATRDRPSPVPEVAPAGRGGQGDRAGPTAPQRLRRIDTRPLSTARRLAAQAVTQEEQELAHQAESLADHAIDLTFAEALRQVAEEAPEPSPKVKALAEAKEKARAAVAADEALVNKLTEQLAGARGGAPAALQDKIEVARAQQELDQDELDMAAEALERNGGDPQAHIKRLKAIHDAAQENVRRPPRRRRGQPLPRARRAKAWRRGCGPGMRCATSVLGSRKRSRSGGRAPDIA
jgi:hypothetical protein